MCIMGQEANFAFIIKRKQEALKIVHTAACRSLMGLDLAF